MIRYVFNIITLFILLSTQLFGQDVQFSASSKNVVSVGEQFRVVYSINNKPSQFKAPSFGNFEVLMGPSTSSSSSIQIINGQVSQSVSYSYTYILQASKAGKYTFLPAEINVSGKNYKSNSLQIEVVADENGNNQQNNSNNNTQNNQVVTKQSSDIFVRVILNKTDVMQGEQVLATIAVYTKLNIIGFEDMKVPSFKGFWSDEIESPTQINLKQEKYNGSIYQVGVIKKSLIIPQHSGTLVIEPFGLTCVVQQRVKSHNSFFDDFFGNYQNVRKKLVSQPVTVHVRPLLGNQPSNFSGAVGNFQLEANVDNSNPKTNEAISYTLKLKGSGNLKLAELPKINFPSDFEQYDPKTTNNINTTSNGSNGTKIVNYLLIPRHHGTFKIPTASFSYFDLSSKTFKTLSTPEFTINVDKDSSGNSSSVISEFSKEDVKYLGSDIHYIKTNNNKVDEIDKYLISEPLFYLLFPLSLIIFVIFIIWRRKTIKQNANIATVKNKKANKVARKRLKKAELYLKSNEKEKFYDEINKSLWGYISDKLIIPLAELSKEKAIENLKLKNISDETIYELFELVDKCEFQRYSPSNTDVSLSEIYNNTTLLINKIEQTV